MTREAAHILFVEDQGATRYEVNRVLKDAGYVLSTAEYGERAIELARAIQPDLVLLSVKLPDMSGFDVLRRLKADPGTAHLPVVHLSATHVTPDDQIRGLEEGADAYLTHPVEPRVLVATLEALLRVRRAEARYRRVFETGLLGIVQWGKDGSVLDANQTFLRLSGYTREDLEAGRIRWDEIIPPEWRAEQARRDRRVTLAGEGREKEVLRKDGTRVPVLLGRALLEGVEDGGVAFVLDISERKRAEESLREADRHKNEFLGTLSHELRTPLAPIRSALDILERAELGDDRARHAVAVAGRQVDHLARLVDDLFDLTRIARGKIELRYSRVDLAELARRAVEDHQPVLAAEGVEIESRIAEGELWVDGDPVRLTQVLENLIGNAVQYSTPGARIIVSLEREGPAVAAFRVRDQGIGIAPEMLGRIFEPFVQAGGSVSRSRGGLGLGLALVKGLVERHGGTIDARSEGQGRGAEFTVRLQLAPGPPAPRPAGPAAGETEPRRILVIDDNRDSAETLRELLGMERHVVAVAHGGREGVETARAFRPDVVLCDLGLPEMDGYEVARALRAEPTLGRVLLVALSGYAQPEDRRRAAEAGFHRHLGKPASLQEIEEVLATAPRSGGVLPRA